MATLRSLTVAALMVLAGWAGIASASPPKSPAILAKSVPPDAGLYFELADVEAFIRTGAGKEFAELLEGLVPPAPTTRPASSQATTTSSPAAGEPASQPLHTRPVTPSAGRPAVAWQQALGRKLGLKSVRAAELLLTGRLALAADGWRTLGDTVIITEPADAAALEAELKPLLVPASAGAKVRRYALEAHHELACDGRLVAIGRTDPYGLYQRTVTLWFNDRRVALADQADFRDRLAALPRDSEIILYTGSTPVSPVTVPATMPAEPVALLLPDVRTAAVGVVTNGKMVTVEASARLTGDPRPENPADPPLDALLHMPESTLVAWTRPIRYLDEYKRFQAAYPEGMLHFYLEVLQTGVEAGALESGLLGHLIGDTILLVGELPHATASGGTTTGLRLPVAALTVETDNPDAVMAMLAHMGGNLVNLLNLQPPQSGSLSLAEVPLEQGGPNIRVLPLGRFFESYTRCEYLRSLEISWTVADRWLVVASHAEMVRQVVRARRGAAPSVAVGGIQQALARVRAGQGTPQMVMIARPRAAAEMIDSWIDYIAHEHPEMLEPDWWHQLRRRQLAGGIQLGIVPRTTTQPGAWVDRTLEGWPAHLRLLPGDQILAVDGQEVDKAKPLESLRQLMANRPKPNRVTIRVQRDGQALDVAVPMPGFDWDEAPIQPLEVLANFADVMRVFPSASVVTWHPSPGMVNARLELELTAPSPITQPATTQPATTQPETPAPPSQPAASRPTTASQPAPETNPASETRPTAQMPAAVQAPPAQETQPTGGAPPAPPTQPAPTTQPVPATQPVAPAPAATQPSEAETNAPSGTPMQPQTRPSGGSPATAPTTAPGST